MPLIIILAECGLELIPREIRNHPIVKKHLSRKNYSSQILDNALHHSAMINLPNREKRGRPDIAHICILNALGTPLSKSGNLRLIIQTVQNRIFEINPEIRITRNFNRFKGLMAKLLVDGAIAVDNTFLISGFDGTLIDLIQTFKDPHITILSSKGRQIKNFHELFPYNSSYNKIVIIGGFQKGNFTKDILAFSDNIVSISKYQLDAWIVVNKIINYYEITQNIS
ncbi:MAG: 16S rRNA methyltransferase [Candidatus Hodarchaeota archaeon]